MLLVEVKDCHLGAKFEIEDFALQRKDRYHGEGGGVVVYVNETKDTKEN